MKKTIFILKVTDDGKRMVLDAKCNKKNISISDVIGYIETAKIQLYLKNLKHENNNK